MKFGRQKLIDLLKIEVDRVQRDHQFALREAENKAETARNDYVIKTTDAWFTLADNICATVKRGEPVTADVIPRELRDRFTKSIKFYEERYSVPSERAYLERMRDLRALIDVLEVSDDDTVSLYSLQKSGFPLGKIMTTSRVMNR